MTQGATLRGRNILVTRPAHQAAPLADAIERCGGSAVLFPAIEIHPVSLSEQSTSALAGLAHCDGAIFISANAVTHGLRHVRAWPGQLPAYAVGDATAAALASRGVAPVITPDEGTDSEALLRLPALMQAAGKHFVIFRGMGGRELLAQTLRQRGARVDYVESYERRAPMTDPAVLLRLCESRALHAVCANSVEALDNLYAAAGDRCAATLREVPHFVSHPRQAAHARALGADKVHVSGTGEAALLAALLAQLGVPANAPDAPADRSAGREPS